LHPKQALIPPELHPDKRDNMYYKT